MNGITFRDAGPEDGSAMLAIHLAAIHAVEDRFYGHDNRESWAFGLSAEGYARSMEEGEHFEVAVDPRGRMLAFCGVKNGEVFGLYVHPDAQGLGLGKALLARGEARAMCGGRNPLPLTASLNAEAFYAAHGYRLVEYLELKSRGGLMQRVARMEKHIDATGHPPRQ